MSENTVPMSGSTCGAPAPVAVTAVEKRRAENWLFWATVANSLAGGFVMTAMDQILLDHHAGDFAAHGKMMAWISSTSSVLSFVFRPLLGSAIDIRGRRPLLLFAPRLQ